MLFSSGLKCLYGAVCTVFFSHDGLNIKPVGDIFQAKPGHRIKAEIGYFALRDGNTNDAGTADIDWFRIEK